MALNALFLFLVIFAELGKIGQECTFHFDEQTLINTKVPTILN